MYFWSHIGKIEYGKHDTIGSNPWSQHHVAPYVLCELVDTPLYYGAWDFKNLIFWATITRITIFVNLGFSRYIETIANIRTWIKSHRYWRML